MKITITPTKQLAFDNDNECMGRLWTGVTDEGHEVLVAVTAVATPTDNQAANDQLNRAYRPDASTRASALLDELVILQGADSDNESLLAVTRDALSYASGLLQRIQDGLDPVFHVKRHKEISYAIAIMEAFTA